MIVIEGIRRCGKSFTVDALQKHFPNLFFFKDLGMRLIKDTPISPDDYAIARDLSYAQFLPHYFWSEEADNLVFDRGYWSTYVYGQCWRDKYNKQFWTDHIKRVEDIYGQFLQKVKFFSFELNDLDFERIEEMDRKKDIWDSTSDNYRRQYELYREIAEISQAKKHFIKAFMPIDYIIKEFAHLKII